MAADGCRVHIVDDDAMVRRALERLICSAGYEVSAYSSAGDFLDSRRDLEPGCLVLDMRLPDIDGMEVYRRLRERGSVMPVIFMTGFGDILMSVQAMKAGAVDFLPKPVGDETLLGAIDGALAEDRRARAEHLEIAELSRRYASLTTREREVLHLVLEGRLNKQIAGELGISEKTVKVHRGRVMTKMGARRVAQVVQAAVRLGLETPTAAARPTPRGWAGGRRGTALLA